MSIQNINIGNVVNDGLGDDLRTAFEKVNDNFKSIEDGLTVTARNIGTTGTGIFVRKENNELQFKNLVAGAGINIFEVVDDPNSLTITNTQAQTLSTYDFGGIDGSHPNAISFLFSISNTDFGTIDNPGTISLDLGALI